MTRAMRACPYPGKDYAPAPEVVRQEQEISVRGGEWYRGRTCPGAVVSESGVVLDVLSDLEVLAQWCQGNAMSWWWTQPAWWTDGIKEAQRMRDLIEAEALKRDAE